MSLYERFSWTVAGKPDGLPEHGSRSPVAKDRDRITHSGALRRLQRKSQIVGVQANDFFRTRLTHTLECAQIGRALAARASNTPKLDTVVDDADHLPDLLEAACLAHDLGHPPFGHNGERALQERMKERANGLFEGNAQSMRIVTLLEPKVYIDRPFGLDLCATTLRAIVKYPSTEHEPSGDKDHPKFCFYTGSHDDEIIEWLYGQLKDADRTLAAEMLEAADDIAYAVHDFEDGVWSQMIPLWELIADVGDARGRLRVRLGADCASDDISVDDTLDKLLLPISKDDWAQRPFDRTRPARAALKNFCARLIGDLIDAATAGEVFAVPLPEETARQIAVLKAMAWEWMIEDPAQETVRYGQYRLVQDIFDGYWDNPLMLPDRAAWKALVEHDNDPKREVWADKARLICDHVAGMTDLYALHVHAEMFGGGGAPNLRLL